MYLDFSSCRLPPFQHQREDVEWLFNRMANSRTTYAFVASEMRTGKTKTVIDLAQFLYLHGTITKVIVVTPAPVRFVWANKQLGEIGKHAWETVPNRIIEYHSRFDVWCNREESPEQLDWYITNFEFLREPERLEPLLDACGRKTLLVGDESSFLKNHKAKQTQAFVTLRQRCGGVILLNGTPIFHSPQDLFSQGNILSPSILDCKFITKFKARYAVQQPVLERGKPMVRYGKVVQEVANWVNLDDLERRFAPHTIRRLQKDCLDLPPKLDPVTLNATLSADEWRSYKSMRDEMLIWLRNGKVVTSATAAIKALRLSQITGGFVGGMEDAGIGDANHGGNTNDGMGQQHHDRQHHQSERRSSELEWDLFENTTGVIGRGVQSTRRSQDGEPSNPRNQQEHSGHAEVHRGADSGGSDQTIEGMIPVGRAKLDVLLWFIERGLDADPSLKLVAWSRFRAEAKRAYEEAKRRWPQAECALLYGGQTKAERERALSLLKPETTPKGPAFIFGIEGTGSFGLDMTASHTCITLSSGYSPGRSLQTLDRVYGPGQRNPIAYYNVIATGPRGQRTIDQDILTARLTGEDIATRTAAAWVKALREE